MEQYFAFSIECGPEVVEINSGDIYDIVQKVPDEILREVDIRISALSLALEFGLVLEDLYVSNFQILKENGKNGKLKLSSVDCMRAEFQIIVDTKKYNKKK